MKKIRVILVDDHPTLVQGLSVVMQATQHIEVVETAATGEQAVVLSRKLQPDVVVMDIMLKGGMNGIEASRQIRLSAPKTQVLILSLYDSFSYVSEALLHGASGYLLKDSPTADIITGVETVAAGMLVFDRELADNVRNSLVTRRTNWQILSEFGLNPKAVEVLKFWYEGAELSEIELKLNITSKTIHNYLSLACHKLQVQRHELHDKLSSLFASLG